MSELTTFAAIDLGSNSFHMIIAREEDGHLQILDKLRETVRLASGLNEAGDITGETEQLALDTLAQMGQRLREFSSDQVRCVGTNTLRRVSKQSGFLKKAQAALGHPIEIIAGHEEARLIYLGTTHSTTPVDANQLVMDIGGGSTELIIGKDGAPHTLESINIGCVTYTNRYFADGEITEARYVQARTQASLRLLPVAKAYRDRGWLSALGCSGTIKAVEVIAVANGWCESGISLSAIEQLRAALLCAGSIENIQIEALKDNRQPVIAGGLVVLEAIFHALRLEHIDVSQSSLREGLLYDLVGRSRREDVREQTVQAMQRKHHTSEMQQHAQRLSDTVNQLFDGAAQNWPLSKAHRQSLNWAAQLCESGLSLSHSKYHRHSEYLLQNSDMPGFSYNEQSLLAFLARTHRSRFKLAALEYLPNDMYETAKRLSALLRLAVLFNRSRLEEPLPSLTLTVSGNDIQLTLDADWLANNPLTQADLYSEQFQLNSTGFSLSIQA